MSYYIIVKADNQVQNPDVMILCKAEFVDIGTFNNKPAITKICFFEDSEDVFNTYQEIAKRHKATIMEVDRNVLGSCRFPFDYDKFFEHAEKHSFGKVINPASIKPVVSFINIMIIMVLLVLLINSLKLKS